MSWVPIAIGGWLVLSLAAAVVVGLSIRLADRRRQDGTGAARGTAVPPRAPSTAAAVLPDPPRPRSRVHHADGTRSSRSAVVRDCLPASERQPAAPTAGSR